MGGPIPATTSDLRTFSMAGIWEGVQYTDLSTMIYDISGTGSGNMVNYVVYAIAID